MKISIVGLGFVGLSLTSVLASKGKDIVGIDVDDEKCANIKKGISPFRKRRAPHWTSIFRHNLRTTVCTSEQTSAAH